MRARVGFVVFSLSALCSTIGASCDATEPAGISSADGGDAPAAVEAGALDDAATDAKQVSDVFADVKADGPKGPTCLKAFGDGRGQSAGPVVVYPNGDFVIGGGYTGSIDFGSGTTPVDAGNSLFIAKFDRNCNHIWSKQRGGGNVIDFSPAHLALTSTGNIWAVGPSLFTLFDGSNGSVLTQRYFAGPVGTAAIAIDKSDSLIATGTIPGLGVDVDFGGGPLSGADAIFVVKFDTALNHVWSKALGNDAQAGSVSLAPNGDVILSGGYRGDLDLGGGDLGVAPPTRAFVGRLSGADGSHVWSRSWQNMGIGAYAIPSGEIMVAGRVFTTVDLGPGVAIDAGAAPPGATPRSWFVGKLAADGSALWAQNAPGPLDGQFQTTTTAGGDLIVLTDVVRSYRPDGGAGPWALAPNATGPWFAFPAIGPDGELVLAGGFRKTITIDGLTVTAAGSSPFEPDVFIFRRP